MLCFVLLPYQSRALLKGMPVLRMLLGSHVGVSGVAITVPTISVTIIKG